MAIMCPDISTAVVITTSGSSQTFSSTLGTSQVWAFTASGNCWIAQGATPTASAGTGSIYVPAAQTIYLDGNQGAKVAVIEDSAPSKAVLVLIRRL